MIEIKIPEIGENITNGTVAKLAVAAGDTVQEGQPLLELETEKATVEIPSTAAGTVQEVLVSEGQEVNVGQVVVRLADSEERVAKSGQEKQTEDKKQESKDQTPETTDQNQKEEEKKATGGQIQVPGEQSAATDHRGGSANSQKAGLSPAPSALGTQPPQANPSPFTLHSSLNKTVDVPAAPSVRRFAREIGIDLSSVPGSGAKGRISIEDVKAFAKQLNTGRASGVPEVKAEPLPDMAKWGEVERQPMSKIRRRTAERLSFSWQTIPHVTQFAKADITEMEALRKKYSTPERKLTITPFLLKVIAAALKQFPQFNSSVDMDTREIIQKRYIHIGVAVDTEHGLLVPVLRDVDKKGILQIADEVQALAQKARDKKLSIDEMQGGTFTITNLGGIGGTAFTPIINWPEVAILGVSRGQKEPGFDNDVCSPRLMLPLSLSYDHRVIDGADGARFIKWITDAIQQPFLLELNG